MERDLDALLPLPAAPYDACDQRGRVSSLSLVRYRTTDYSVPVAYGHRDVLVRGYVDRVVISCGSEVIARHPRSYQRDDFVFDPIHYLPLLERKTGALDQAAPCRGGTCPGSLPRCAASWSPGWDQGQAGVRPGAPVAGKLQAGRGARRSAGRPRLGALSSDAVKQLVLCRLEGRPPRDLCTLPAQGEREHHLSRGLHGPGRGRRHEPAVTLLLEHHLGAEVPSFLREYGKMAAQCAAEGVDHPQYLLRLAELELIDRHQRMVQRRIRAAHFPAVKSLDTFDFPAIPSVNKQLVMELARCEYIQRRENVIAVGNSGTGKTHVALGLGLAACQKECPWAHRSALVHERWRPGTRNGRLNLQLQLSASAC